MENINKELKKYSKFNVEHELKSAYATASKNPEFAKLVNSLKIKDDIAYKYTTKLELTMSELNNCKSCASLNECKNAVNGYIYYPTIINDTLEFNYAPCKYKQNEKAKCKFFDIPLLIQNARLANVDVSDKKRSPIIKWLKKFYDEYQKDKHIKGLYLSGSFGSGKTYIISALLNELSLKNYNIVMVYFPAFLLDLKEFGSDYQNKIDSLKYADLILLDDIGAENVSSWSRDEILGTILQYRMDNALPTFFTSNYKIEELEIKLSNNHGSIEAISARRVIERIKQLTDQLDLVSENRRK